MKFKVADIGDYEEFGLSIASEINADSAEEACEKWAESAFAEWGWECAWDRGNAPDLIVQDERGKLHRFSIDMEFSPAFTAHDEGEHDDN